jgi:choline kinase
MSKAALVVMAAGIGSRFGGGIKQLEPVGPNGEIIMDYSVYDAMEAGFDKVVFVIRKDLEKDFKEIIGNRIAEKVQVEYAFQEVGEIPEPFRTMFAGRTKPWGTGQAILCCRDVVQEPFLVINADDYYGKEAYRVAFKELEHASGAVSREAEGSLEGIPQKPAVTSGKAEKLQISMVGFVLANTLSENGGVTRGICQVDESGMLSKIVETSGIVKTADGAAVLRDGALEPVDVNSPVSMNMWGLVPEVFGILDEGFTEFLAGLSEDDLKSEYLLPTIIGGLLAEQKVSVKVLESRDKWFGVTYKEDKESVVQEVRALVDAGLYPDKE